MERWNDIEAGTDAQIGVDVAAFGSDKTVIAVRRGRKIENLNVYTQKSTRETAGLARHIANMSNTRNIKVDEIGVGRGVVDSLEEDGFVNIGVNVAERASNSERFVNLRAELWWSLRESLDPDTVRNPEPLALPPDDDLLAELSAVKFKFTSRGAIQIESKEDMKRRLGRSPDRADAVCLALYNVKYKDFADCDAFVLG